jgi:hypothetical protein
MVGASVTVTCEDLLLVEVSGEPRKYVLAC